MKKRKQNNLFDKESKKVNFLNEQGHCEGIYWIPWGILDLFFEKIECRSWLSFSLVCKKWKESANRGIYKLKEAHQSIIKELGIKQEDYPLVPKILREKNLGDLLILKKNVDSYLPGKLKEGERLLGTIFYNRPRELTSNVYACLYQGEFIFKDRQYMINGKGRMLFSSDDFYEGYVYDFHINGDGKYYKNGILHYEGGFLHYRFHNYGKLYYPIGVMQYKGQFSNGKYHGKGELYYPIGVTQYKGQFSNGKYHGKGELYYPIGVTQYKGQFSDGKYHGEGELYYPIGVTQYKGQFSNGKYHGKGELYYPEGILKYKGDFSHGDKVNGEKYSLEGRVISQYRLRGFNI